MRKIIHIDQDCFYAAVEQRDNPSLKGKAIAVGGRGARGVLTTASYEARKYGVRSAMPTQSALRMCPDLIVLPPSFQKYKTESQRIRKIFRQYTDKFEPVSLDEAYLDVSESSFHEGSASLIASEIRNKIFLQTGLTASAGIAPNKFLAKVASDWNKPNGQFTIPPSRIESFVKDLPVEKIPGVGKVTLKKLHQMNIYTCKDLQDYKIDEMQFLFGKWGVRLFDLCRGIDHRSVGGQGLRKTLSVERTFTYDKIEGHDLMKAAQQIFAELVLRLKQSRLENQIIGLVVKIKFSDFNQTTLSKAGRELAFESFQQMVTQASLRSNQAIRLIGLGVRFHKSSQGKATRQLSLFD
ncbi:MAG: DNA polymerase IV [Bdellovibrionales bacterium]|nr:DNA polymerase IV [Bdellovibrionales bacterium]